MIILQKFYPTIEIDTREIDIVQICHNDNLVEIERENIPAVIAILEKEIIK